MLLKQSTARDKLVFMTDSADHVSGKTGLTLTITASKNGAGFSSITPTVTERGNGWYSLALTSAHTDTLGDLALHITATGADPTDVVWQVVAGLPGEAVTVATNNDKTGYSLTQSFPANFASLGISAGGAISTVTNLTNLPSIPANWLTSAGIAAGALNGKGDWLTSGGYTAPDNAGITAIKAKTDLLTYTVAGVLDVNVLRMNSAVVLGDGTAGNLWRG